MGTKYYATLEDLEDLKSKFSEVSHTHTKADITDFDISEIVDAVIAQLPDAEESDF